jgi:hypothetical protein
LLARRRMLAAAITSVVAGALLLGVPAAYAATTDLGTASDPAPNAAPNAADTTTNKTAGTSKEVGGPLQEALETLTHTEGVSSHVGDGLDSNVQDLLNQLDDLVPNLD